MRLMMKMPLVILSGLAIILLQKDPEAGEVSKLDIRSDLQVFYASDNIQGLVPDEELNYFLHLDQTTIFPGTPLSGGLTLRNRTGDTLWLAPPNKSLLSYVRLLYREQGDTLNYPSSVAIELDPSVTVVRGVAGLALAQGTFIPPHAASEINVTCAWESLCNLRSGIYEFTLLWDNTTDAALDKHLYSTNYRGRLLPLWINKRMESRLDSIYVLQMQARRLLNHEKLDSAWQVAHQLLQMDSLDFWALRVSSDAAWKLGRFEQAATFASKAVSLLEYRLTLVKTTPYADEIRFFLQVMQERQDLIRRREPYRIIDKSFN